MILNSKTIRSSVSAAGFLFVSLWMAPLLLELASADESGGQSPEKDQKPQASANYSKDSEFLPGEEVVTPTGQKMKIWSTKGPVDVSKAPEPFEDREKSTLDNTNIDIDLRDRLPRRLGNDSFDHTQAPHTAPSPR